MKAQKYRKLKAGEAFKPGDQQLHLTGRWRRVAPWMRYFKVQPHEAGCFRRPLKPKNFSSGKR